MTAKYEEKFIVLPLKYTEQLSEVGRDALYALCVAVANKRAAAHGDGAPMSARYYVCNQDEPYADQVIKTILDGETRKEEP